MICSTTNRRRIHRTDPQACALVMEWTQRRGPGPRQPRKWMGSGGAGSGDSADQPPRSAPVSPRRALASAPPSAVKERGVIYLAPGSGMQLRGLHAEPPACRPGSSKTVYTSHVGGPYPGFRPLLLPRLNGSKTHVGAGRRWGWGWCGGMCGLGGVGGWCGWLCSPHRSIPSLMGIYLRADMPC